MQGIIDLSVVQVAFAYVFVLIVLVILRLRGIGREKELVVASVRMTLQLILTGYVLVWVFDNPNPFITAGIIILMETFALFTVFRKFRKRLPPQFKKAIALGLGAGTLCCLFYFLLVVVRIAPWYQPQYFIPIAGMIVGNSLTGVSLAVKTMLDGMEAQRALVEEALVLGATPAAAAKGIVNGAFDSAILPTITSMLGMGVIFLPGMMTGQILSGTAPTTAIAYQIAIMCGILGAVALSVIIVLRLGYRSFFNGEDQLMERMIKSTE